MREPGVAVCCLYWERTFLFCNGSCAQKFGSVCDSRPLRRCPCTSRGRRRHLHFRRLRGLSPPLRAAAAAASSVSPWPGLGRGQAGVRYFSVLWALRGCVWQVRARAMKIVTMTKLIKKNFTQRFSKAVMNVEPRINYTALNEPRMHYTTTRPTRRPARCPPRPAPSLSRASFTCHLRASAEA